MRVSKLPAENFAAEKMLSYPFSNWVHPLVTDPEITFILEKASVQVPTKGVRVGGLL